MEPIEITTDIILELINSDTNKVYTDESSGLQHTHWRVHYTTNNELLYEAICKNSYGSAFGIGIYGTIILSNYTPPTWFYNWTDVLV